MSRSTFPRRTTRCSSPTSALSPAATGRRRRSSGACATPTAIRCRKRGCPAMADFLADPGPPLRGRRALTALRRGRLSVRSLVAETGCAAAQGWWDRGRPTDPASLGGPRPDPERPAIGRVPAAVLHLWVGGPTKLFCPGHDDRWQRHGRPDLERFIADCELVGTARIDLRALAPQLRLEFQYALQCRHDTRSRTAPPRLVIARRSARRDTRRRLAAGPDRAAMAPSRCDPAQSVADVPALRPRRGRGTARRHRLGGRVSQRRVAAAQAARPHRARPAAPAPAARLRFDRITQPWLRELAKRWTRLRLTSGLSIGTARAGVDALTRFSDSSTPRRRRHARRRSTGRCWNATWPRDVTSPADTA